MTPEGCYPPIPGEIKKTGEDLLYASPTNNTSELGTRHRNLNSNNGRYTIESTAED